MHPVRRQISRHAAPLRRDATDVEKTIWTTLRNRQFGGYKFRRQWTIGPYIADFTCIEARLIVELDGGQHTAERDARRAAFLEAAGYRVMRFWNNEVVENRKGVLEAILNALIGRTEEQEDPHPTLSREGGRGLRSRRPQTS